VVKSQMDMTVGDELIQPAKIHYVIDRPKPKSQVANAYKSKQTVLALRRAQDLPSDHKQIADHDLI
jgi:hypothetical protein